MKLLSDEQIQKYVEEGGVSCPYCGDADIEGGFVEIESGGASQKITCPACDRSWRDEYRLARLVESGD